MQVLETFLHNNGFSFYTRENPATDHTEDIFFCHKDSHRLWRAFPDVLLIDTTYKTNMYDWPFVQFVGVTSTSKSFCIAHAFLIREREQNFTWALGKLKEMLDDYIEPRVIVTDRDKALMNSCDTVFPYATKNLCRWHISENIKKKYKSLYQTDAGETFGYFWKVLYTSPTVEDFYYNCGKMEANLARHGRRGKLFTRVQLLPTILPYISLTHRFYFLQRFGNTLITTGWSLTKKSLCVVGLTISETMASIQQTGWRANMRT